MMTSFIKADLHMHSVFSDGMDSPEELLRKVKKKGIDIFALTDHDCIDGCETIINSLQPGAPAFIRGVEFSCRDENGKYHILGYLPRGKIANTAKAVEFTHSIRLEKVKSRLDALEAVFGFVFTDEDRRMIFANKNPGKPHIVELMLEKGFVSDKEEGFAAFKKIHTPNKALTPEEAIEVILADGGIPVLAHGFFGDGSQELTEEELSQRIVRLKNDGLKGLEAYYASFTARQVEFTLKIAEEYNLLVTAGSDYHGEGKHNTFIGNTNFPNPEKLAPFFAAAGKIIVKP